MRVSRWDGHPNEDAHRIFAEQLLVKLRAALARHQTARIVDEKP